ncbi:MULTISPECIES: Fur family transcriptional regulator [Polyangium]|uniref:Transcriptional repressor n=1 Tax=Polyangium sorediatum TaxID=889274 RepID=A0ABT6NJ72_9BACT|nr:MULTISPECIES: transcriptional repressor [Polyangium]MDI1428354.1 transcriptional repressor [Polyangium sorediatum]
MRPTKPAKPIPASTVRNEAELLERHGVLPSAQRLAIAQYVLRTDEHPSADQVFAKVQRALPMVSRATVYNTLNLFVDKGLLRAHVLAEGKVVFDPNLEPHHHFIDEETGAIHDVPWSALAVSNVDALEGFDVHEYQVVLRGKLKKVRTS